MDPYIVINNKFSKQLKPHTALLLLLLLILDTMNTFLTKQFAYYNEVDSFRAWDRSQTTPTLISYCTCDVIQMCMRTFVNIDCSHDCCDEKSNKTAGHWIGSATQYPLYFLEGVRLSTIPGRSEANMSHFPFWGPYK